MRTYQSVSYGTISFLKKRHFTKEGWDWLKKQLCVPKDRFNDGTSTVDFDSINVVFKTTDFDFDHPETMTLGFRFREGKHPGWKSHSKKERR